MIVQRWHSWVKQPVYDRAWHERDVADELQELAEARGLLARWSELSDVVYTVTRGRWSGHNLAYPIPRALVPLGYLYMYPKYTSRVVFFRTAGRRAGNVPVQSVRNPKKVHKLVAVANDHGIDPEMFVNVCSRLLRRWPLLP